MAARHSGDGARRPASSGNAGLAPAPAVWRAGLVLAVGLLAALVTTSSEVRIPPSALALLAAATLVGAALLAPVRWLPVAAVLGALVAGATAGHVLLAPGMPRVHDLVHVWGIWSYGRAVHEGVLYPLWMPYLGAGIPLLQFYGPVNFLLALPGILLGLSPVGAWKLEMYAGHVLSALSMLCAARMIGAGWRGALVAATAFAFAPWRLANFDFRGALGESNAFLFMPLVAAATLRMARHPQLRTGVVLALSAALLLLTHAISLFTLCVVLVPALVAGELAGRGSALGLPRRAVRLAVPWAIMLGLTAAWWVPVAAELRYTAVSASTADNPYFHYTQHGIAPAEIVERRQWDLLRVSLPEARRGDYGPGRAQMPFYVGSTLALMALTAPWWSRARGSWPLVAGAAAGLSMATTFAAQLSGKIDLFEPIRFPWRFLSPATVLAALALGLAVSAWNRERGRWWRSLPWVALVACLIWDGSPYTGAADRIPAYEGVVHWHLERPERWDHWETSLQPAPVTSLPDSGVVRVRDLWLPPSRYDTAIDCFFPGYVDWLTPEIYRRYWRSVDPTTLALAGVTHGFDETRAEPIVQRARPYAGIEYPGGGGEAIGESSVRRRPGRIVVEATVRRGGGELVVLEQAFPGWTYRLDDRAPRKPDARGGFLVVPLPEGPHRVRLEYGMGTPARRSGLIISSVSLLAAALLLALARRASTPA